MESGPRIISLSAAFGLAAWVLAAAVDAAWLSHRTFGQAFLFGLTGAEWLVRLGIVGLFVVLGIVGLRGRRPRGDRSTPDDSAKRYLDIAGVMILALDAEGRVTLANRKAGRVLGCDAKDIIGREWFELFVPERERERLRRIFGQLMAGELTMAEHVENAVVTRNGDERIIAWHNTVLRDATGRITGTLSSGEDVTDRRRMEERNAHLNGLLRAIRDISQLIAKEQDRDRLLEGVCACLTGTRDYHCAWIALLDERGAFQGLAHAGLGDCASEVIEQLQASGDCRWSTQAVAQPGVTASPADAPSCQPCDLTRTRVDADGLTIRLEYADQVLGLLHVALPAGLATDREEQTLLEEVADDLAFALHSLALETRHDEAVFALRRSDELQRRVIESIPIGIWVADRDLRVQLWSTRLEQLTGRSRNEMLGARLGDRLPDLAAGALASLYQRVIDTGQPAAVMNWALPAQSPEAEPRLVNVQVSAMRDGEGSVVRLVVAVEDVTEQRRAEEALRRTSTTLNSILVSATEYAIAATDRDNRIVEFNPAAEHLFGFSAAEVVGRTLWEVHALRQVSADRVRQAVETANRDGKWEAELEINGDHGRKRLLHAVVMPMRGAGPEDGGLVLFAQEITERRHLEEQLRQAQKMEAVGTLASGIAHDFNNLLTAIYGYTELAKATLPEGHAASEALDMVERAAHQASGVTRSLLTFSRKGGAHKQPFDLALTIRETIRLLRHVLPASIELKDDVPVDRPVCINGDAMQVQQVLMNLAVNARDAMPGGGRLTIRLRTDASPPPGRAIVTVEDTGAGMTEETRSRVFEPFYTTKPRGKGTGLGMAIIHGIVTDHRGVIDVESDLGHGTRLEVSLPCCEAAQAEPAGREDRQRAPGRGERILVVEDDAHVRAIVTSSLRSRGYEVIQAVDGIEAMEMMDTQGDRIELIVLDLDLPRKSGETCLEEIRTRGVKTPVIITSGSVQWNVDAEAMPNVHTLRKPFQMVDLAGLVGRLIAEPQTQMEGGG